MPPPESGAAVPAAILLRGLRHGYPTVLPWRRREVLRGLDLELAPGERLGLVGPNGSGKTTLLRVLAGLEPRSGGELAVLGGDPASRTVRTRIGFLPEDAPFPRELRALEALELFAELRGVDRARARTRARELLDDVGLSASARATLGGFSRGMLRRFGLAQALVHAPELVLLDEPTAGLDAQGFAAFDRLLGRERERGATVVLASHLLGDLQAHCDRWLVLHEGTVAAQGTPEQVLAGLSGASVLEIEGLDAAGFSALERAIAQLGGRTVSRSPASSALRALYGTLAREPRAADAARSVRDRSAPRERA